MKRPGRVSRQWLVLDGSKFQIDNDFYLFLTFKLLLSVLATYLTRYQLANTNDVQEFSELTEIICQLFTVTDFREFLHIIGNWLLVK